MNHYFPDTLYLLEVPSEINSKNKHRQENDHRDYLRADRTTQLVPAPPGMGRQRQQNTQEDRGYHGDARGHGPQHFPRIALYTPTSRYLLLLWVYVG